MSKPKWYVWGFFGAAAWLIVSPWVLGYASYNLVAWNSIITGTVVILLTLWSVSW